jgi:hypothetical protein
VKNITRCSKFKKQDTQEEGIKIDGQMIKTTKIKDVACATIESDLQTYNRRPSTENNLEKITSGCKNNHYSQPVYFIWKM